MRFALVVALLVVAGCERQSSPEALPGAEEEVLPSRPKPRDRAPELAELAAFEEELRARTRFGAQPPSDRAFGPDPYAIEALPGGAHAVGILRGADTLALVDNRGRELSRTATRRAPSALAVAPDGTVWVGSELSGTIERFQVARRGRQSSLTALPPLQTRAHGIRDIAVTAGGHYFVASEYDNAILSDRGEPGECRGAQSVALVDNHLVANCLLERALKVWEIQSDDTLAPQAITIEQDGPFWSLAAARLGDGRLFLIAGGVEDRPLDRSDEGSFGYIDSFLFAYTIEGGRASRLGELNGSALGVITPKWLEAMPDRDRVTVTAFGYGGTTAVRTHWPTEGAPVPTVEPFSAPPGIRAATRLSGSLIAANPLLDSWVTFNDASEHRLVPLDQPTADPASRAARIGEALFFTTLLSPWAESTGRRSRFTCETCHFEGYTDGRTHYTGRGEVHATTKPLVGLFENRPHFSRALDRNTAVMIENEFRVANLKSGRSHWFAVDAAAHPWLSAFGELPDRLSPLYLRQAFLLFFARFTHRPQPAGTGALSESERRGMKLFAAQCEQCHQARTAADRPESRQPMASWEAAIRTPAAPLLWATSDYRRTGVTPYVHPDGARVPSLRRLYKKYPYFTNGSASSLRSVLSTFARTDERAFHAGAPREARRLSGQEADDLRAFLLRL